MHRKVIGTLHLLMGTLALVPVMVLTALFGGVWAIVAWGTHGHEGATLLGIGLATILLVVLATAAFAGIFGLIAGFGVLMGQKWGDILATAISAIHLFNFPFGTALAAYTVYGLWLAEPSVSPNGAVPQREFQTSP